MRPDDHRHGTEAGNEQHWRDNEPPCDACHGAKILAARRRSKRKAMGHEYTRALGPVWHRIDDMHRRGISFDHMAAWAGISPSQVWTCHVRGPEYRPLVRTWQALHDMKERRIVTTVGVTRRIQGLMWMGYSAPAIAAAAGVNLDSIRDARDQPREWCSHRLRDGVKAAFDRLASTIPAGETQQHRAGIARSRGIARRNGWAAPHAWLDIDDPNETPDPGYRTPHWRHGDDYDFAVVERLLAGDFALARMTSRAEKVAVCVAWAARGDSLKELERMTGWESSRYLRMARAEEAS